MTIHTNFCPDCGKRGGVHTCSPAYAMEKADQQERAAEAWFNAGSITLAEYEQALRAAPVALVLEGAIVKVHLPENYTGHLYMAPPVAQRQPLTDEQIAEIYASTGGLDFYLNFARAIEAKIKENT